MKINVDGYIYDLDPTTAYIEFYSGSDGTAGVARAFNHKGNTTVLKFLALAVNLRNPTWMEKIEVYVESANEK